MPPTNQLGDRALFFMNSSTARNKQLYRVKTAKETDNKDAEHAHDTGHDDPVGIIRKPGGGELELSVYEEKLRPGEGPEVDWEALQKSGEFFSFTRQVVGGRRRQYLNCTVVNVAADDDDAGGHMITVKILWFTRETL